METIGPATRICANPQHMQSAVRDEAVILAYGDGAYFALNAVGVRVWSLVQTEIRFEDLVAAVVAEFEVTAEVATQDLSTMLVALERHGLVELRVAR